MSWHVLVLDCHMSCMWVNHEMQGKWHDRGPRWEWWLPWVQRCNGLAGGGEECDRLPPWASLGLAAGVACGVRRGLSGDPDWLHPGVWCQALGCPLEQWPGHWCGPLASACEMDHRQLGELGEAEEVGDYQPVAQAGCFGPVGEKQQAHPIPEACSGPTHSQGLSPAHAQPCRGRVWIQPWPCSRWKCWKCGGESAGGIWPSADLELCKSWSWLRHWHGMWPLLDLLWHHGWTGDFWDVLADGSSVRPWTGMEGKHVVCEMVAQHELDHVMIWSKPMSCVCHSHVFACFHSLAWLDMVRHELAMCLVTTGHVWVCEFHA